MGYDFSIYVGPYIKVPTKMESKTVPVKARCVNNKSHRVDVNHKFCPACGSPTETETTTKSALLFITPQRVEDFVDGVENDFYTPESCLNDDGYTIWLPNRTESNLFKKDDGALGISQTMMSSRLAIANADNRDVLIAIKEHFGVDAIVEFGVVGYWM